VTSVPLSFCLPTFRAAAEASCLTLGSARRWRKELAAAPPNPAALDPAPRTRAEAEMSILDPRLARFLINRYVVILVNLLLLFICLSTIREMVHLLATPSDDSDELVAMATGIAVMLYGYGVSLELRPHFMSLFNIYPHHHSPQRDMVDQICSRHGILLLLVGLFLEVLVQLVEIPSRIINVHNVENLLFAVGVVALAIAALLLVHLSFRLVKAVSKAAG
jgi:hypothetical protein